MIHAFNRAVLVKETDAASVAKIKAALKEAGIPYEVKTESSGRSRPAVRFPRTGRTGNIGSGYSGGVYLAGGIPHSWTEKSASDTAYIIYVRKKDLERAKEICRDSR